MAEQWIAGCAVLRIMFRDNGVVINFDDYNELVISAPLDLTLPPDGELPLETVRIDPARVRNEERPLFDFSGTLCTHAVWNDNGDLQLSFSDGHAIDVPHDEHRTAWELYGKYHGFAACLRRGRVRVVRLDLPDDEDD